MLDLIDNTRRRRAPAARAPQGDLKDLRLPVLDDATGSLDSGPEALIQEALKRATAGRTSIVIAHRLSTIPAADLILVSDRGRIVERGTHAALLATGGPYARLVEMQFRHERNAETTRSIN